MSSNSYNYNYTLAHLNSLNPVTAPEMSDEDLARELALWSNTQFIEVPSGMSLLEEEFQVSPTIDAKLDQNVTQPTLLVQHDLTTLADQTQTQLHYPLFFQTANSLVPNRLQPITIATSSNDNFTPIYPAAPIIPVTVSTNTVNNPVILSKETQENTPSITPSITKITTDPTPTVVTKTTTKTSTKSTATSTTPSSTSGSNRKSTKSSTSETTQNGSETKEGEKDTDLAAKLAAEEDKRRRNTAASARFRVKKKMREQALERTAREMTTKAEMFEGRVKELEMEIKWLRSLIVEKDARLLDVERPGKRRKKDQSGDDDGGDDEDNDEKEEGVKQEQSEQANKKE